MIVAPRFDMLACLPLIALLLVWIAMAWRGDGLRLALIKTSTYWGIAVVAVTETLSVFHGLTPVGLGVAWLLIDIAAALYLRGVQIQSKERRVAVVSRVRTAFSKFDSMDLAILSGIGAILALVGFTALIYPPNTDDAMVYHMPRIVEWLHNRTVAFYPTVQLRQLKMGPWAEFAMLQFQGLTGGDRFANLIQWFAMFGSVAGVSLIAEKLGASFKGQVFAAFICAAIPEGLLEASGAKNDYVVGYWLVVLVVYLFLYKDSPDTVTALGTGASLGLACLTKTTAFVLAPPLIAAIAILWPRDKWRVYVRHTILAGAIALALNAGYFSRNYRIFGTPV